MKVRIYRVRLDEKGTWKDVPGMVVGILQDETEYHRQEGTFYVSLIVQEIGELAEQYVISTTEAVEMFGSGDVEPGDD